jgi:hypothetical protein
MFGTTIFVGISSCQSVMPFISIERSVMYRERFAGMYSPWAYSFAQVNRLDTNHLHKEAYKLSSFGAHGNNACLDMKLVFISI